MKKYGRIIKISQYLSFHTPTYIFFVTLMTFASIFFVSLHTITEDTEMIQAIIPPDVRELKIEVNKELANKLSEGDLVDWATKDSNFEGSSRINRVESLSNTSNIYIDLPYHTDIKVNSELTVSFHYESVRLLDLIIKKIGKGS